MEGEKGSFGESFLGILLVVLGMIAILGILTIWYGAGFSAAWGGNYDGPSMGNVIGIMAIGTFLMIFGGFIYVKGASKERNRFSRWAILSLILGIASILFFITLVVPILAIIFGVLGIRDIKRNEGMKGQGLAISGIILGGIFVFFMLPVLSFFL